MGRAVFNNQIFDNWLDRKADEILSKVDRATISTEEMIILILKAQTNHFHHMDEDIKGQIGTVNSRIDGLDKRIDNLDHKVEKLDNKMDNRFMWTIGLMVAGFSGLYLKLFFT